MGRHPLLATNPQSQGRYNAALNIMNLPQGFDRLIQFLLRLDTESEIRNSFAASCFAVSCFAENIPIEEKSFQQMGDTKPQIIGIALLAVDDAKNTAHPSSANSIYRAIFNRAKQLMVEPQTV